MLRSSFPAIGEKKRNPKTVSFVIMTRHKKWQRYYIKPSESLIVRQGFHYSCLLLYWYRRRYFNPLHTHKHHEDDMQNTWTVILVCLLLELLSFEQWTKSFLPCTCVHTVSWKLFKIFSGNFTQMQNTMKRRAKHMNCNFFFFFFFFIWVLRPFQEYFTYIEPIVHRRWAKTGEPGEKPPDHP